MGICSKSINRIKQNKKYVFKGPKSYNMIIHKNDKINDYIIELILTKIDINAINQRTEFIIVLDVSGSMKAFVHEIISAIIPNNLNLLNYSDTYIINLITIQTSVNYYKKSISESKNDSSLKGFWKTYMSNVFEKIKFIFYNNII